MSYRGSKPSSVMSNQSGFDGQFSDLAMSACPPSSKRPRTSYQSNHTTPKKVPAVGKNPLKFDFRPISKPGVSAMGPPATGPRYVNKPVLASQAPSFPSMETEPDWADDDDDLLLAASQMVDDGPAGNKETDQEQLLAMTALLDDEDFGMDDVEFEETFVAEMEKEEQRLNQTLTVFESEIAEIKPEKKPLFKAPVAVVSNIKDNEENERLKKLHLKSQGEVAMLREEMKKKEREIDIERMDKRRIETELKNTIQEQKVKTDTEVAGVKTEKIFLLQEIQQLKEKFKKIETTKVIPKPQPLKEENHKFKIEKEFSFNNRSITKSTTETQTENVSVRKCLMRRSRTPCNLQSFSFCRTSNISPEDKVTILQTIDKSDVSRVVGRKLKMMIQSLKEMSVVSDNEKVVGQLRNIQLYLTNCSKLVTGDERRSVTETCSNLVTNMIRSEDFTVLVPTLSLLVTTWSPGLLEPDITTYVLSLLSQVIHKGKPPSVKCRVPISPGLITAVVRLVELVTRQQPELLCKQSIDDCSLFSLIYLLHQALAGPDNQIACRSLVRWVLTCTVSQHPLPFIDNRCTWCTGDLVRLLTTATQGQVRLVLDTGVSVDLLKSCVLAIIRTQDMRLTDWVKGVEQTAGVQRKYIWSVGRINTLDMGDSPVSKLADLRVSDIRR